jgi:hypothetical protein
MDSETALHCPPEQAEPALIILSLEQPETYDELARLAKAMGHPARLRILRMLFRNKAQVCGQILDELPLPQSTSLVHLRILKDAQREITKIGRG